MVLGTKAGREVLKKCQSDYAKTHSAALLHFYDSLELLVREGIAAAASGTTRRTAASAPLAPAVATSSGGTAVVRILSDADMSMAMVNGTPFVDWLDTEVYPGRSDADLIVIPGMSTTITAGFARNYLKGRFNAVLDQDVADKQARAKKTLTAAEREECDVRERRLTIREKEQAIEQAAKDADAKRQREDADAEVERQRVLREDEERAKEAEARRQRDADEATAKRKREEDDQAEAARKRQKDEAHALRRSFIDAQTWDEALLYRDEYAQLKVASGMNANLKGARQSADNEWKKAAAKRNDPTNGNYALGPEDGAFDNDEIPPGVIAYYNGSSSNTAARVAAHLAGQGSVVTRTNTHIRKRVALLSPALGNGPDSRNARENLEVLYRMRMYGINHCRGGCYADLVIDQADAFDKICCQFELCRNCGAPDHKRVTCNRPRFDRYDEPLPSTTATTTLTEDA